jgi:glycerol-3-phosphate acyltransferase PlsY
VSVAGAGVALAAGYLIGGVLFAAVVSRRFHRLDIRNVGSGNPGFTNVYRVLGRRSGAMTLAGDLGKGAAAAALGRWFVADFFGGDGVALGALAGVGAILGHMFPLYFRFRGGKGVATAAGAFACVLPAPTGIAVLVWLLALLAGRYMSLASVLGSLALPVATTWVAPPAGGRAILVPLSWVIALGILLRHRSNLARLLRGREQKFTMKRG